jgi:hypothetical protein
MESILDEKQHIQATNQRRNTILRALLFLAIVLVTTLSAFNISFKSKLIGIRSGSSLSNPLENRSTLRFENITNFPDEITIPYFKRKDRQRFSKFHCTGAENDIATSDGRLCIFSNVCYHRDTRQFHYFRLSQSEKKPLFYDSSKGMLYQFSDKNDGTGFLSLSVGGGKSWAPIISVEPYPKENFTSLHQLHSLMQCRFADSNIGHGLWEDLGSISYSLDRMSVLDRKLVIMHFDPIPDSILFRSYTKHVIPALSEYPMMQLDPYARSFNTNYVCFDKLMVGGQLSVFPKPFVRENHGREALFYNWRSKMIQYNGFDPKFVPSHHRIIITNKSQSLWTRPGAKRHRSIVNMEEVEKFIRLTYPTITTEVIEWHTLSFRQQVEKLLSTTILITPCGGVSLILPLLPRGAHAIVMDYYVNTALHGFSVGQSGSMDGAFLNHISHVRMQYYQLYGVKDYEFDYPGASDAREGASVIVNTTRLRTLIDKALEEMEP